MGAMFRRLLRETFKVHSKKKRKGTKVRRQWPTTTLRYYGRSWPQVVGLTARQAESKIKGDCPGVYCEVRPAGSLLTMSYCSNRVRVLVDRYGKVARAPCVG